MKGIKAVCDGGTTACDLVDANGSRSADDAFVLYPASCSDMTVMPAKAVSSAPWSVGLIAVAAAAASPAFAGAAPGDNVIRLT